MRWHCNAKILIERKSRKCTVLCDCRKNMRGLDAWFQTEDRGKLFWVLRYSEQLSGKMVFWNLITGIYFEEGSVANLQLPINCVPTHFSKRIRLRDARLYSGRMCAHILGVWGTSNQESCGVRTASANPAQDQDSGPWIKQKSFTTTIFVCIRCRNRDYRGNRYKEFFESYKLLSMRIPPL